VNFFDEFHARGIREGSWARWFFGRRNGRVKRRGKGADRRRGRVSAEWGESGSAVGGVGERGGNGGWFDEGDWEGGGGGGREAGTIILGTLLFLLLLLLLLLSLFDVSPLRYSA